MPHYTGWKLDYFRKYMAPRNKRYCELHGYKYIETSPETLHVSQIFPGVPDRDNIMFFRWQVFKNAIETGMVKDGDIINHFDCDVYIAQPYKKFETTKSFTYAIDSGNTHCMGIFSMKINDFTKKLIDAITSRDRFEALKNYPLFKEDVGQYVPFYACDQHAYYHTAGIKPHSWVSFLNMPNFGFHSCKTEYTIFSLDELKEHVEILGPEWNTTHLIEETGENGKPNYYDIVHIEKEKVINRHFAGGQPWLCPEWEAYSQKYV